MADTWSCKLKMERFVKLPNSGELWDPYHWYPVRRCRGAQTDAPNAGINRNMPQSSAHLIYAAEVIEVTVHALTDRATLSQLLPRRCRCRCGPEQRGQARDDYRLGLRHNPVEQFSAGRDVVN